LIQNLFAENQAGNNPVETSLWCLMLCVKNIVQKVINKRIRTGEHSPVLI